MALSFCEFIIFGLPRDFACSENKLFANTQDKLFPIFGGLIPELTKKEGGEFSLILIFFLDFAFLFFPGSMF